jgi:hypothetical protein
MTVKRNRKCRDSASGLPGGLSIGSFVEASTGDCVVKGIEQAVHVVEIQNRSLLRFKIDIIAQCESGSISYAANERSWAKNVQVSSRPATGGAYTRKVTENLISNETSIDESITVSVKYEAIGCRCSGAAELALLVDTRV